MNIDIKTIDPFVFCKANVMQHETGHLFMSNCHNTVSTTIQVSSRSGEVRIKDIWDVPFLQLTDLILGGPVASALLYDREDYDCLWWVTNSGDLNFLYAIFERTKKYIALKAIRPCSPASLDITSENIELADKQIRFHRFIKERWEFMINFFKKHEETYLTLLKEVAKLDFDSQWDHTIWVPGDIKQIKVAI